MSFLTSSSTSSDFFCQHRFLRHCLILYLCYNLRCLRLPVVIFGKFVFIVVAYTCLLLRPRCRRRIIVIHFSFHFLPVVILDLFLSWPLSSSSAFSFCRPRYLRLLLRFHRGSFRLLLFSSSSTATFFFAITVIVNVFILCPASSFRCPIVVFGVFFSDVVIFGFLFVVVSVVLCGFFFLPYSASSYLSSSSSPT